jgi:hypothetical protein
MNSHFPFDAFLRNALTLWEIAFATPQVMGHRIQRMILAGPRPGARDRREFTRMGQEKLEAFGESWIAMGLRVWQANAAMGASVFQQGLRPWLSTMAAGMKPVHRRVTSNARRLSGTGRPTAGSRKTRRR